MIHPLSPPKELKFYLNLSKSKYAITLDAFYNNFKDIMDDTSIDKLILAKINDYLPPLKKIGFKLTTGCFIGTFEQFKEAVSKKKEEDEYRKEYEALYPLIELRFSKFLAY